MAIPNTLNETQVGQTVAIQANFIVPLALNTNDVQVTWELQDVDGSVYANGQANSVSSSNLTSVKKNVVANSSMLVPTTLPVDHWGTKYQVLWTMYNAGVPVATYIETFMVAPAVWGVFGVPDIVQFGGQQLDLTACLPSQSGSSAQLSIFAPTGSPTPMLNAFTVANPSPSWNGNIYKTSVPFSNLSAQPIPSLSPHVAVWQYTDRVTGQMAQEDGYFYFVNPSILSAARELQQLINRANNMGRLPELTIDTNVCIAFLKMGMDYFNSMGMPTYFTMTNASGPIRSFWLAASEVLLLQSQYLLEAERSMNMQGQQTQLDLDITSYYETIAAQRQQYLDQFVPDFKRNTTRRGVTSGDGNVTSAANYNVGAVGIALSPVANYWAYYSKSYARYNG